MLIVFALVDSRLSVEPAAATKDFCSGARHALRVGISVHVCDSVTKTLVNAVRDQHQLV